ncbi:hypothetical protein ACFQ60_36165 [Streptomyces zhihengii]
MSRRRSPVAADSLTASMTRCIRAAVPKSGSCGSPVRIARARSVYTWCTLRTGAGACGSSGR